MKFSFRKGKQLALETFLVAPGGGAIPATSIFHKNFLHMVGHLFRTNPHLYPRVRGRGGGVRVYLDWCVIQLACTGVLHPDNRRVQKTP